MAPALGTFIVPVPADEEMETLEVQSHVCLKRVMQGIKFVLPGSRAHIHVQ